MRRAICGRPLRLMRSRAWRISGGQRGNTDVVLPVRANDVHSWPRPASPSANSLTTCPVPPKGRVVIGRHERNAHLWTIRLTRRVCERWYLRDAGLSISGSAARGGGSVRSGTRRKSARDRREEKSSAAILSREGA